MPTRPAVVAGLLLLAACNAGTEPSPAVTRDSAGISIIENAPPSSATPVFQVADSPLTVLGSLDAAEAQQFGSVLDVSRLPNGHIVVADGQNVELRVFDSAGTFMRSIGRKGEGPGEFSRIGWLVPADSGIHAWDWGLRRLTSFSAAGEFLGDRKFADPPPRDTTPMRAIPQPRALLGDGRALVVTSRGRFNSPSGTYRDTLDVWMADASGALTLTGASYRGASYILHFPNGDMLFGSMPFGPQGTLVPTPTGWLSSGGEAFEVVERSAAGSVIRIVRVQRPLRPVTDVDRAWFMDSLLAEYPPETHESERKAAESSDWGANMPAYDRMVRERDGHVWARIYPYDSSIATWDVFDAEGRLVATASTPASIEVKQIGPDWVLGTTKGEMDEPLVVLYRLTR